LRPPRTLGLPADSGRGEFLRFASRGLRKRCWQVHARGFMPLGENKVDLSAIVLRVGTRESWGKPSFQSLWRDHKGTQSGQPPDYGPARGRNCGGDVGRTNRSLHPSKLLLSRHRGQQGEGPSFAGMSCVEVCVPRKSGAERRLRLRLVLGGSQPERGEVDSAPLHPV
jgi:hypothetical protein